MTAARISEAQLHRLLTYVRAGSAKAAAHDLGMAESTLKNHLSALYRDLDVLGVIGVDHVNHHGRGGQHGGFRALIAGQEAPDGAPEAVKP